MSDNLLLLGGTDVTLAVAEAAMGCGIALAGIVAVGESFSISYSETRIKNARSVAELAAEARRACATLREIAEPCVVTGDGLLRIVEASDEAGSDQLDNLLRSAHKRFDS